MKEGILDSLRQSGGIATDEAMARLAGIPEDEYAAVKTGKEAPSALFLASIALTFSKNIDQLAEARPDTFKAAA